MGSLTVPLYHGQYHPRFHSDQLLTLTNWPRYSVRRRSTRKYARRNGFDYVLKGGTRWYFREISRSIRTRNGVAMSTLADTRLLDQR